MAKNKELSGLPFPSYADVQGRVKNFVSRRTALRLLAGGAAGGLLARFGLTEAVALAQEEQGALSEEERKRILQFVHPAKLFGYLPGFEDEAFIAALYGLKRKRYQALIREFDANAREAAQDLLTDAAFVERVARLPFQTGATVVVIGESSTDDLQSWLTILRHLLELSGAQNGIQFIDEGVSGRTTTEALGRFTTVINRQPDWIVCFLGGNDASRYGQPSGKTLIGLEETKKNFAELRRLAEAQTEASWVWITMYPVDEARVAAYPPTQMAQLTIANEDITPINDFLKQQTEPVIDLEAVFGLPPSPKLLLTDGFHPSLAGHKAIVKVFVERLTA